jgi:hypothetical protein
MKLFGYMTRNTKHKKPNVGYEMLAKDNVYITERDRLREIVGRLYKTGSLGHIGARELFSELSRRDGESPQHERPVLKTIVVLEDGTWSEEGHIVVTDEAGLGCIIDGDSPSDHALMTIPLNGEWAAGHGE